MPSDGNKKCREEGERHEQKGAMPSRGLRRCIWPFSFAHIHFIQQASERDRQRRKEREGREKKRERDAREQVGLEQAEPLSSQTLCHCSFFLQVRISSEVSTSVSLFISLLLPLSLSRSLSFLLTFCFSLTRTEERYHKETLATRRTRQVRTFKKTRYSSVPFQNELIGTDKTEAKRTVGATPRMTLVV